MKNPAFDLEDWSAKMAAQRLPRWSELPNIELYMDQVVILLESYLLIFMKPGEKFLTAAMINNYVKSKVLPPPVKKRYGRAHLAYLVFICLLKQVFPISEIHGLLIQGASVDRLPALYDSFCTAHEKASLFLLEKRRELSLDFINNTDANVNIEALNIALLAAAGKTMAEKLMEEKSSVC